MDKALGVKRAVLIGINYFGTSAELAGCINDIYDIETYLRGLGFTEFTILKDNANDPEHKFADSPTRANIVAAMKAAIAATKAGDCLYIHYSGHGSHSQDVSGDEQDGEDECICPVDYNSTDMIYDDELNDILVNDLIVGAKLRAVFDCCHSGTSLDLPIRWVVGTNFSIESNEIEPKDIMYISGCRDHETSSDASFANRPNGALTWAFLQCLAEIKKSGSMSKWKDLGEMMRFKLRREGFTQIPALCMERMSQLNKYIDLI